MVDDDAPRQCQGEAGAYSEKSLRELLGPNVVAMGQESFEDVFKAVSRKRKTKHLFFCSRPVSAAASSKQSVSQRTFHARYNYDSVSYVACSSAESAGLPEHARGDLLGLGNGRSNCFKWRR